MQRYADQILIERGYVAERAQQVELRTVDGPMTLGEAALGTVLAEGLDDRDLLWDSWRRPDGRWVVVAIVLTDEGEIRAAWIYDTTGRTVHAQDEAARWLMGASEDDLDRVMAQQTVIIPTEPRERPRLIAVSEEPPAPIREVQQPQAHQPAAPARRQPSRPQSPTPPRPVTRSVPAHAVATEDGEYGDFSEDHDDGFDAGDDFDGASTYSIDDTAHDDYAAQDDGPVPPAAGRSWSPGAAPRSPASTPLAPRPASRPAAAAPSRGTKGRGKRRASVPTWDEILFGATRNEES